MIPQCGLNYIHQVILFSNIQTMVIYFECFRYTHSAHAHKRTHVLKCLCKQMASRACTYRGQRRRQFVSLELGPHTIVRHLTWALRSKLGSTGCAVSVLNFELALQPLLQYFENTENPRKKCINLLYLYSKKYMKVNRLIFKYD